MYYAAQVAPGSEPVQLTEIILLIDHVNLSRLDLNLLVAFDALAVEGNLTRAAGRIGIGQPAMSHALGRLRILFNDELFVRAPEGIRPTPRATALIEPVRTALAVVQQTLSDHQNFAASKAKRTFFVGMPDSIEIALLPRLIAYIQAEAPDITIRTRSTDRFQVLEHLDDDRLHLAIGPFEKGGLHHKRRGLYAANYECLYHPERIALKAPISLDQYLSYPHVLLGSLTAKPHGVVDDVLAKMGLNRTIGATTAHFIAVPYLLQEAAMISTCVQPAASMFCNAFGLRSSPVPITLPDSRVSMLWHSSYDKEPSHRWLRQAIVKLTQR